MLAPAACKRSLRRCMYVCVARLARYAMLPTAGEWHDMLSCPAGWYVGLQVASARGDEQHAQQQQRDEDPQAAQEHCGDLGTEAGKQAMLATPPQERPAQLLPWRNVREGGGGWSPYRPKPPVCWAAHDGCAGRAVMVQESPCRLLWPRHCRRLSARLSDRQARMAAAERD